MRAIVFAAAGVLFLAGPALADGPVTTAGGSDAAAPPQPAAAPAPLPTAVPDPYQDQGPQVAMGPCGPEKVKPDGTLETKPHGEVEVGVGTGGYRHVAGAVCQPIGQNGVVAASVSAIQASPAYRRR